MLSMGRFFGLYRVQYRVTMGRGPWKTFDVVPHDKVGAYLSYVEDHFPGAKDFRAIPATYTSIGVN